MPQTHPTRRATVPPVHDKANCDQLDVYGWPLCPACAAAHETELERTQILDPLGSFSDALLHLDDVGANYTVRDGEIVAQGVDPFTAAVIGRHRLLLIECWEYHAGAAEVLV
jgi:hypothetical protein